MLLLSTARCQFRLLGPSASLVGTPATDRFSKQEQPTRCIHTILVGKVLTLFTFNTSQILYSFHSSATLHLCFTSWNFSNTAHHPSLRDARSSASVMSQRQSPDSSQASSIDRRRASVLSSLFSYSVADDPEAEKYKDFGCQSIQTVQSSNDRPS